MDSELGNIFFKLILLGASVGLLYATMALAVQAYSSKWGRYKEIDEECQRSDENLQELQQSLGYGVRDDSWIEKKFKDLSDRLDGIPEAFGAIFVFGAAILAIYLAIFKV